ncbi:hypothetical protein OG223_30375 [Streptomyces sp. NBC_01478]|uniref:hypothetical protein n=1 Tax=Streptomyces sp. NBC_01478 TaxID=2903882 RepID=UPI002E348A96|nr:hypothetical protein [Streptomyces sp. NBC_01478]
MPARITRARVRVLATTAAVLATLLLSGCKDGTGVRDEGPSGVSPTSMSTGSTP